MPNFVLTDNAVQWLASGEKGISSCTIFEVLTGLPAGYSSSRSHPRDPDDFKRCERLLRQCPELRERLEEMRAVSPDWANLVDHWDELVAIIEEETPGILSGERNHGSAPKAYLIMKNLGC